ncbi:acetaldehyde dehydrogenase (acetylating) [Brevibacillus sp. TJ4]|uniref:acetaldehyde dehydrogenase (acetylating) n=1 Tax=Brevibacillus sp. TJ4 TaxID=3234853 RepID=UPI0037CD755C
MEKRKVAILGSGNIGTDLMIKLGRSEVLELTTVIGIDPQSDGLRHASRKGYTAISTGIDGFLEQPELADLVFDATSAKAHARHDQLLRAAGKTVIDLTPAALGPFVVPTVNLGEHLSKGNVNMITCGGQATIPMVYAVSRIAPVAYAEIVATISSRSAGPGTRANIDEFTETTARAIEQIGGAREGKAIIIINPAEPPIIMRDTVYVEIEGAYDKEEVRASIYEMAAAVQSYVPGYRIVTEPIFEGSIVTILLEVEGSGDYLPKYAGNLDIMTAAAVKVAEELVKKQTAPKTL